VPSLGAQFFLRKSNLPLFIFLFLSWLYLRKPFWPWYVPGPYKTKLSLLFYRSIPDIFEICPFFSLKLFFSKARKVHLLH
jgi:hypothetical protein